MECNKDDAIKAADLAEKKYLMHDLAGAKKFCSKALQLYPSLERARQMLAVVEVHTAAQQKSQGLEDWYGVLQVDPFADDATIKKQYRKMALMLHPDKNRLVGAEPAFKLINEAWMILSDKNKKTVYDVKRSASNMNARKQAPTSGLNGFYNVPDQQHQQQQEQHQEQHHYQQQFQQPEQHSQPPPQQQQQQNETQHQEVPSTTSQCGTAASAQTAHGQPTFWTQCPSCKIQYQYYRKFENYQLLCHRCKAGFLAIDIGVPPLESSSWPPPQKQSKKGPANGATVNGAHEGSTSNAFQQMQQRAREREEKRREEERKRAEKEREREEKRRLKEALRRAKEEDRRREALEKQLAKQREREEREARKKNMEALKKKLKRNKMEEEYEDDDDEDVEDDESDEGKVVDESIPADVLRFGLRRSSRTRRNVVYRDDFDDEDGEGHASKRARMEVYGEKLSPEDILLRRELANKGRQFVIEALRVILNTCSTSGEAPAGTKTAECKVEINNAQANDLKQDASSASAKNEQCVLENDLKIDNGPEERSCLPTQNFSPATAEGERVKGENHVLPEPACETVPRQHQEVMPPPPQEEVEEYLVPDPDFHNFDTDRKEGGVYPGQIWALYDDTEGMPRFYCEIKQVVSLDPFKVKMRWLERYEGPEGAEEWEEAGYIVTCGQFKCKRRSEPETSFNKFSHLMQVERIHANVVSIFPKRGEVWAIYRDWSLGWLQSRNDGTKSHKYDMVEVLTSYLADTGMTVLPLVKVEGFKTIFARGSEPKTFDKNELLRFSHKVPAHWMTGKEKPNAPKDCWELDTAATPAHLIFNRDR